MIKILLTVALLVASAQTEAAVMACTENVGGDSYHELRIHQLGNGTARIDYYNHPFFGHERVVFFKTVDGCEQAIESSSLTKAGPQYHVECRADGAAGFLIANYDRSSGFYNGEFVVPEGNADFEDGTVLSVTCEWLDSIGQ